MLGAHLCVALERRDAQTGVCRLLPAQKYASFSFPPRAAGSSPSRTRRRNSSRCGGTSCLTSAGITRRVSRVPTCTPVRKSKSTATVSPRRRRIAARPSPNQVFVVDTTTPTPLFANEQINRADARPPPPVRACLAHRRDSGDCGRPCRPSAEVKVCSQRRLASCRPPGPAGAGRGPAVACRPRYAAWLYGRTQRRASLQRAAPCGRGLTAKPGF